VALQAHGIEEDGMNIHTPNRPTSERGQSSVLGAVTDFSLQLAPDQIPQDSLRKAGYLLLDTLGVAIAAAPMEAGRIARETACALFASNHATNSARMLFDGRSVGVAGAAFAAATQIDNLDAHDGYNPTKGHIGVVAVPTLAALAEQRPDLSGPEALATLIIGYEVAGRAAIALHASASDYHTSGAWNALGVVAMAARLRNLSATQMREALGIAEYHGPRSQMMREIANPTMLHDGSGWGALVGLSSVVMAESGFTGAPAVTIEEADSAEHWQDLGTLWQIDLQYIKPYPICRWAHAPMDAAREMCADHQITADQIAALRINSFHNAIKLFPGMPETTSQAQYSLPFAVATMIARGKIGLSEISGDGLKAPDVAALVAKTELRESPRHEDRYPHARWADLEIELNDGTVLHSGDVHARGGPERPFSEDEIVAKFMEYATSVVSVGRAEAIRDAALNLSSSTSRFSDLLHHLHAAP